MLPQLPSSGALGPPVIRVSTFSVVYFRGSPKKVGREGALGGPSWYAYSRNSCQAAGVLQHLGGVQHPRADAAVVA